MQLIDLYHIQYTTLANSREGIQQNSSLLCCNQAIHINIGYLYSAIMVMTTPNRYNIDY